MKTRIVRGERPVGGRVRLRRRIMGRSQAKLGAALGVGFQQVQKYELVANRFSAAKLLALAEAMDRSVAFFFDGLAGARPVGRGPAP